MKNEGCLLWEQARTLGQARKLEITGECPVNAFCKGTQCVYLSEEREDVDRTQRMFSW